MSDRVGEQFGDYRLTRKLGGGTFGDVYLGEHTSNNMPAAIKILQARLINSEDLKDYINEIRSLFRLQHPNIVPLLDFGIERDTPFLIMAYAPNGTLRQPKGTRLPLDTVVGYIQQIAEALQHAHDRKLIHRDVKPDNILSGPDGQVWLSDFGIVSIAQSSRSLNTQDGAGTIPYMAPEQILGKPRLASDQYALGIIAYEWICGSRPFNGTAIEIAMQHAQAQPPLLREQVPTLSSAVEQVVLRALAKDSKDRFASVREFAEALASGMGKVNQKAYTTAIFSQPCAQAIPPTIPAISLYSTNNSIIRKANQQWLDQGITFNNAKMYDEAVEAYNHAIEIEPKDEQAYSGRADAYYEMREYAEAVANYTYAIALNPRYEYAYEGRGNAYFELKRDAKAIADYTYAIALNPRNANAYGGRGLVYYFRNDYERAVKDFDYALQLEPRMILFLSEREDAYRKLGRKI